MKKMEFLYRNFITEITELQKWQNSEIKETFILKFQKTLYHEIMKFQKFWDSIFLDFLDLCISRILYFQKIMKSIFPEIVEFCISRMLKFFKYQISVFLENLELLKYRILEIMEFQNSPSNIIWNITLEIMEICYGLGFPLWYICPHTHIHKQVHGHACLHTYIHAYINTYIYRHWHIWDLGIIKEIMEFHYYNGILFSIILLTEFF